MSVQASLKQTVVIIETGLTKMLPGSLKTTVHQTRQELVHIKEVQQEANHLPYQQIKRCAIQKWSISLVTAAKVKFSNKDQDIEDK